MLRDVSVEVMLLLRKLMLGTLSLSSLIAQAEGECEADSVAEVAAAPAPREPGPTILPITVVDDKLKVPPNPIIPYIPGDGIGPEIMAVTLRVVDEAVALAYGNRRSITWHRVSAGMEALEAGGNPLPAATLDALRSFRVGIKGPTGTPTGGGHRSVNVALRQELCLGSCVRPVVYSEGLPSPIRNPQRVKMVIFRENTEDVYAGIEFAAGSEEAKKLIELISQFLPDKKIDPASAIGIKPMSEAASKANMRQAMRYAIENKMPSVTVVHKGNIQKETEGAFLRWSNEVALQEFGEHIVLEKDVWDKFDGKVPEGKIVLKERIADNMFQEIILKPQNHSVVVAPNLNGDYLSDAIAALVGGLGIAPGANIGDNRALFEATHGTAPDIAGQNKANPSSTIKSAIMMLEYMGWVEARDILQASLDAAYDQGLVTGDLRVGSGRLVATADFLKTVLEALDQPGDAEARARVTEAIRNLYQQDATNGDIAERLRGKILGTTEFGDQLIELMRAAAPLESAEASPPAAE